MESRELNPKNRINTVFFKAEINIKSRFKSSVNQSINHMVK